jgi:hypothetical protein
MAVVVTLFGVLLVASGVMLAVAPTRPLQWAESLDPGRRFWGAVLFRAAFGVCFLLAAPSSRMPLLVQVLGWAGLVGAALLLLLGRRNLDHLFALVGHGPTWLPQLFSVPVVCVGALLIYAGA